MVADRRTFLVPGFPAHRVDAARAVLNRLARQAERDGHSFSSYPEIQISGRRLVSRCLLSGAAYPSTSSCEALHHGRSCEVVSRFVVDLEISIDAPVVGGWELIGRVELVDWGSDNLIYTFPGVEVGDGELARWRSGAIGCDHCRVDRRRSDVVILRALDDARAPRGSLRQVGRNCLSAFTGAVGAPELIGQLGWPDQIWDAGEDGAGGWGSGAVVYPVEDVVAIAAAIVRADGYVSRARAREAPGLGAATADRVRRVLGRIGILEGGTEPTRGDRDLARQAIGWALSEDEDGSDYRQNLRVLAGADHVGLEHVGVLSSLVVAFGRAMGDRAARGPSAPLGAGDLVGEVGKMIEVDVKIEHIARLGFQSKFSSVRRDAIRAIRMRDDEGRALLWKTSSTVLSREGERVRVRGRVVVHRQHRGQMETEITRCRVVRAGIGGESQVSMTTRLDRREDEE